MLQRRPRWSHRLERLLQRFFGMHWELLERLKKISNLDTNLQRKKVLFYQHNASAHSSGVTPDLVHSDFFCLQVFDKP